MILRRWFFLACASAQVFSFSIHAMTLDEGALAAKLEEAILVAEVRVLDKTFEPDPVLHARWKSTFRIDSIKEKKDDGGWFPKEGETIVVRGIGGEWGDLGVLYDGFPRPFVGKRYRAFLVRDGDSEFQITGFLYGLRPLVRSRGFSRNRTDGSDGSGSGAFLTWENRYFPLPYFISFSSFEGLAELVEAIDSSFLTWTQVTSTKVDFFAMGCTSEERDQNDGINAVIRRSSSWEFGSSVIGLTRNFFVSGESPRAGAILDSDILLNFVDHQFTVGATVGSHDVQNIMTHEIGHLLGMGHEIGTVDTDATMYAVAATNEIKKRTLESNDEAGVRDAYGGASDKVFQGSFSCNVSTTAACASVKRNQTSSSTKWFAYLMWLVLFIPWVISREKRRKQQAS